MENATRCSIDGCDGSHLARGWCNKHYQRWRKYGSPTIDLSPDAKAARTLEARSKITADSCILWMGYIARNGYGYMSFRGIRTEVHRVAWTLANGPIPTGMEIDHRCWNRACMNVDHLRLVTTSQNHQHRQGANRNNKASGVQGVYWNAITNAWMAKVQHEGRQHYAGTRFATIEEAAEAARQLRNVLFTHNDRDRAA
ncbi:HNH endonuclease signature motif containing protein [Brevibacterium casei]|uniref:AP2 domain-containing protein n=1 Tax=Brevibacterium casei CIP 102111 TaxID=1255625 RepID=A0A2H1IWM9_9MICO|nr:HNH endonuclease signature motif containing protein [Brevibacterium casei]QPR39580.1 HNH endonuclease [Brevibacterium casei]QPR43744.1 HNH endonuclease [Brevibacterium casei]SMX79627.1 AP2 domain-containing protein [Brevibacterium casei CIP 102111]